ncbi:hypothetical protein L6R52_44360, partial [Myxococcota bacterium]|nr:hypothetical protein [Myxococcota bacterium]
MGRIAAELELPDGRTFTVETANLTIRSVFIKTEHPFGFGEPLRLSLLGTTLDAHVAYATLADTPHGAVLVFDATPDLREQIAEAIDDDDDVVGHAPREPHAEASALDPFAPIEAQRATAEVLFEPALPEPPASAPVDGSEDLPIDVDVFDALLAGAAHEVLPPIELPMDALVPLPLDAIDTGETSADALLFSAPIEAEGDAPVLTAEPSVDIPMLPAEEHPATTDATTAEPIPEPDQTSDPSAPAWGESTRPGFDAAPLETAPPRTPSP